MAKRKYSMKGYLLRHPRHAGLLRELWGAKADTGINILVASHIVDGVFAEKFIPVSKNSSDKIKRLVDRRKARKENK